MLAYEVGSVVPAKPSPLPVWRQRQEVLLADRSTGLVQRCTPQSTKGYCRLHFFPTTVSKVIGKDLRLVDLLLRIVTTESNKQS